MKLKTNGSFFASRKNNCVIIWRLQNYSLPL
nr:MAG TPA: hypothetical protein [Caudoviricetes sp.]